MTSTSPGGTTPPRMGESLPHIPLAGAEPRDGACGAGYVSGGCRRRSASPWTPRVGGESRPRNAVNLRGAWGCR